MGNLGRRAAYSLRRAANFFIKIRLQFVNGLTISKGVEFNGKPIVEIRNGAKIEIGSGTTINSCNAGHHVNMHSPVKLFADRRGALIRIGRETRVHGSCMHAYSSITIGDKCLIGANCQIIDSDGHALSFADVENRINTTSEGQPIVIEDCVWLGANTIVLPGVRVGRGSVVGAGSVITKDIPPMVLAAGNPATPLRTAEQILRGSNPVEG